MYRNSGSRTGNPVDGAFVATKKIFWPETSSTFVRVSFQLPPINGHLGPPVPPSSVYMKIQKFDLQVFDHLETNDPTHPQIGLDIVGDIGVTIHWADDGVDLDEKGVVFSAPVWGGPGGGPFTVYDNLGAGMLKPLAKVSWSLTTETLKRRETDTPTKRFRWIVAPVIHLKQHRTPTNGSATQTTVAYIASNAVKGAWKLLAP